MIGEKGPSLQWLVDATRARRQKTSLFAIRPMPRFVRLWIRSRISTGLPRADHIFGKVIAGWAGLFGIRFPSSFQVEFISSPAVSIESM